MCRTVWCVSGSDHVVEMMCLLVKAPLAVTGAGERALAAYVAETRETGSSLRKFILLPQGGACCCCALVGGH